LYFFLDKKVPKNQDSACFAQKTSVQKAKTPKLAAFGSNSGCFLTLFSLVLHKELTLGIVQASLTLPSLIVLFWLTRRGRSAGCQSFCEPITSHSAKGKISFTWIEVNKRLINRQMEANKK